MSAFVTLLLVVDPVGLVPAFLAATHGLTEQDRRRIAVRSPLIAAQILVTLALCGNWLLRALGIGIAAFQIAGGLLLFGVSYGMIFGDRPHREAREADKALSEHAADIAVFPLAIPLMAGSAAIATTLLLSNAAGATPRLIIVIVTILLVCLLCMLCFTLSSLIARTSGRTGNAVFSRLLGMLLAAYSVQFVLDGLLGGELPQSGPTIRTSVRQQVQRRTGWQGIRGDTSPLKAWALLGLSFRWQLLGLG